MVRQWQSLFYNERYPTPTCTSGRFAGIPDFVKLADAYGAVGLRARRPTTSTRRSARRWRSTTSRSSSTSSSSATPWSGRWCRRHQQRPHPDHGHCARNGTARRTTPGERDEGRSRRCPERTTEATRTYDMTTSHPPCPSSSRTSPASSRGSPALFSRRGFNIDSLAVGPTELPDVSRMTVVVDVDGDPLEQVTKQLNKLVEVLKVIEIEPTTPSSARSSWSRCAPTPAPAGRSSRSRSSSGPRRRRHARRDDHRGHRRPTRSAPSSRPRSRMASRNSSSPAWSRSGAAIDFRSRPQRSDHPDPGHPCFTPTSNGRRHMADMLFYDDDADLSGDPGPEGRGDRIRQPGHAHALNLRDSGVDVRVGLAEGSKSRAKAEAEGPAGAPVADAVRRPTSSSSLTPTRSSARSMPTNPSRTSRRAPRCSSAMASTSGSATSPRRRAADVIMVAPKGPGPPRAPEFVDGRGVPRPRRRRAGRLRIGLGLASRTPRRSAVCGPAGSRRPSPRRARPTCSASRRSSAAGLAAGHVRLRDPHRGGLPARGRLLRVPSTSSSSSSTS